MTTKTNRERAEEFAAHWYGRPQSGCDQATLAGMLEEVLDRACTDARIRVRERAKNKLAEVLDL